jgi:polyisoprenoid-binding protein YceI
MLDLNLGGSPMRKHSRLLAAVLAVAMSGAAAVSAFADTFKIDPVHSSVVFKIKHANVNYVYGRFNEVSGTFTLDGDKSTVEAAAPIKSVDTNNPKRDEHIKGPDFFNSKQFPEVSFKSTKVEEKDGKLSVTGDLTLHGVTKSITVALEKLGPGPLMNETRAGLAGEFTIKRSEFGMDKMLQMLGDEVTLYLGLEGVKQ